MLTICSNGTRKLYERKAEIIHIDKWKVLKFKWHLRKRNMNPGYQDTGLFFDSSVFTNIEGMSLFACVSLKMIHGNAWHLNMYMPATVSAFCTF